MTHVFKKAVLFAAVVSSVGASAGVKAVAKDLLSVQTRNGRILGAVLGVTQVALHGAVPMYQSTDKGLGKFKAIDKLGCVVPTGINRTGFTARVAVPAVVGFDVVIDDKNLATLPKFEGDVNQAAVDALLLEKGLELSSGSVVAATKVALPAEVKPSFVAGKFTVSDKSKEAEEKAAFDAAQKAAKEADDAAVKAGADAIAKAEAFNKVVDAVQLGKAVTISRKASKAVEARAAATKLGTAQNASTLACYVYLLGAAINYKSAPKA